MNLIDLEQCYNNYSIALDGANSHLLDDKSFDFFNNYYHIMACSQELMTLENRETLFSSLEEYFLSRGPFISIKKIDNSTTELSSEDRYNIYPINSKNNEDFLLIEKDNSIKENENLFYISCLLSTIEEQLNIIAEANLSIGFFENAISKINLPFALLSPLGDMIVHNSSFSNLKLLPKECLDIKEDEKIELNGVLFYIFQSTISIQESDCKCFVFFKVEDASSDQNNKGNYKNISSNELGIISSSIAHELNNPIAGILAGIELIKLDESIHLVEEKVLLDIENSAVRIKELIRIFLGFSRLSLESESKTSPYEVLLHARDLIRFRMVESNICLDLKQECHGKSFGEGVYSAIGTMTFYLILNEIVTAFAHFKLIAGENKDNLDYDCIFKEYSDRFEIHFYKELLIKEKLDGQKLIEYLNKISDLKMDVDFGKVVFYRNT